MKFSELEWDRVRRVIVNPNDLPEGSLPQLKALAASHGATIVVSRIVPPGKAFVLPKGMPDLNPCPDPYPYRPEP